MSAAPTVLYVTGMTRCGSTMIGNVLNEVPGVVHLGELHFLWRNGILGAGTNSTCGCGEPLRDCPLWSDVLVGDVADRDLAMAMTAVQDKRFHARHTLARCAESRGLRPAPADVSWSTGVTRDVYHAVADRCAARVIVDSSKYPAEAAALCGRHDLDVRVLHVVRDPRATAFSYRKDKSYVRRMGAARSTATWWAVNAASDLLALQGRGKYLRLRHEDFGAAPHRMVTEIMRFVGITGTNPVDPAGHVDLGDNHTVTGNPDRLHRGQVAIRCDERWQSELGWRARLLATAGAWPHLGRYGYPLAPGRTAEVS